MSVAAYFRKPPNIYVEASTILGYKIEPVVQDAITKQAAAYNLNETMVLAVVLIESSANPWATQYEPHYKWVTSIGAYARRRGVTRETEEVHQKTSWGLGQIMGGTARSLGFFGDLPQLAVPQVGLFYSCKYMAEIRRKHEQMLDIVAAYNRGHVDILPDGRYKNYKYVDKFKEIYQSLLAQFQERKKLK